MLATVSCIDIEFVIVNSNFVIWVARGEGNLDVGGEENIRRGDVESIDSGSMEDETWLCWPKD